MLKNLIKGGKQSKAADDSGSTLVAAVNFLGQTRNVRGITPYGLYNSPVLGSNWIVVSNRANSEDLHGIGNDYKNRPKNLIEGEVVLQNLLTGAFIKEHANGDIEIFTDKDIIATAANVKVTASESVSVDAAANITATAINITATATATATVSAPAIVANCANATVTATAVATVTAPAINLNGYVKIIGGLEVDGIVYGTHIHGAGGNPPMNP